MPEESLDTTVSLDWLVGLRRTGGVISAARQEAHLRVDRFGVRGPEWRLAPQ